MIRHDGAAGDRDLAIRRLMDLEGGRIHALALRLCGDAEDAADLVQETFLNAWRGWERFEGRSQASTWLYTIATRACRRQRRRQGPAASARLPGLADLLPDPQDDIAQLPDPNPAAGDPAAALVRQEALSAVSAALAELPEPFRLAVVLKDIAELPVADVASILGLREATVKTRVHRGRLALRQALARQLPSRPAPPPEHERSVCLDLLQAKQEALDRGVPFPVPPADLCQRCRSLLGGLDLAQEACHRLGEGELPVALRAALEERMGIGRGRAAARGRTGGGGAAAKGDRGPEAMAKTGSPRPVGRTPEGGRRSAAGVEASR